MFKKKLKYVEISILYDKNFSSVRDTDTNYINWEINVVRWFSHNTTAEYKIKINIDHIIIVKEYNIDKKDFVCLHMTNNHLIIMYKDEYNKIL